MQGLVRVIVIVPRCNGRVIGTNIFCGALRLVYGTLDIFTYVLRLLSVEAQLVNEPACSGHTPADGEVGQNLEAAAFIQLLALRVIIGVVGQFHL